MITTRADRTNGVKAVEFFSPDLQKNIYSDRMTIYFGPVRILVCEH